MSRVERKSVRKYLKIKYMFHTGDPKAQYKWDRYAYASNGLGIALQWVNKGVRV